MKKALAALALVLVLLTIPVATAMQFPRQVDPATAPTDAVYGQGLYLFYGAIVDAIAAGNTSAASQLLGQASFIHIPAEILDTYDTFNGLIGSTASDLTSARYEISNASMFYSTGRLANASASLQEAISNLNSANATLTELFAAAPNLAAITGIPSTLLLQKLAPLKTTYSTLFAEAQALLKAITGAKRLALPTVTLSVTPTTIETGGNITVSGVLLGPSGTPLPSRLVTVYFANTPIGDVLTGASGAYSASLRTPYYYKVNATVFASYHPTGGDALVYSPASSTPVRMRVTFLLPALSSLSVPPLVYAGQSLTVSGALSFGGQALKGYGATLSGFPPSSLSPPRSTSSTTGSNGSFSLTLAVPSGASAGVYTVTLATSSNRSIGPLVMPLRIFVVHENPTVTPRLPSFAIAGLPFTVSGTVTANGTGLSSAKILNVDPTPKVDTVTSSDGAFSFTVIPPLVSANGGWTYRVGVYPSQSWVSSSQVKVDVYVINPLFLLFPASSLGLLFLVVRRRRGPAEVAAFEEESESGPAAERPKSRTPPSGLAGVYAKAVALMEAKTSVVSRPQTTVREYLGAVRGKAKGIEHFEYISSALEMSLYGGGVGPEVEERAKAELAALRGELEA